MNSDKVRRTVGPFSLAAVTALVAVGLSSFSAWVVLSAFAPLLRDPSDGGAHALSKSAVGYAGLVRLIEEMGASVVIRRGPSPAAASGAGLLILTPDVGQAAALAEMMVDGTVYEATDVLIVLPKWGAVAHPSRKGWVERGPPYAPVAIEEVMLEALGPVGIVRAHEESVRSPVLEGAMGRWGGQRFRIGPVTALQSVSGPGLEPVVVDEDGRILLARVTEIGVFVLSDPDLLNTHGLADVRTARAAWEMLSRLAPPDGAFMFDVTLAGHERSRNILQAALSPPFLPAILCLVAAAGLLGVNSAFRSGPARAEGRAIGFGKAALVRSSAGLVALARREADVAPRYLALVRRTAAAAAGVAAGASDAAQTEALDRISAARGRTTFTGQSVGIPQVRRREGLLEFARALHHWRKDLLREHD